MIAIVQRRNGHAAHAILPPGLGRRGASRSAAASVRFELPRAFVQTALCYLTSVLPPARRETGDWRALAAEIPDSELRRVAERSLEKRGNIEGAALFAVLAPPAQRMATIRALVAFQTAYNYLDALSELPSADPAANADQLHQALLCALTPGAPHADYYAEHSSSGDGGYLRGLVDVCRSASSSLPSFEVVAPHARSAAARIRDFQTLNAEPDDFRAMRNWAKEHEPNRYGLEWWEAAAACGSSLSVHALISGAAAGVDPSTVRRIEELYFRRAGALHSLMDSLVDRREDEDAGLVCLLDHYGSSGHAAARLRSLAERTIQATAGLPRRQHHRAIVTAMCSYYLSAPECGGAEAAAVREALTRTLGPTLTAAVLIFRARRGANRLLGRIYE
jgi:tetraprenyl-beta-curcumene synthase